VTMRMPTLLPFGEGCMNFIAPARNSSSTDNGAEEFSWPDGGTTPFHGEKNSSWEGGYRVPAMIRWPGVIKAGTEINGIVSHEDWVSWPTIASCSVIPSAATPKPVLPSDAGLRWVWMCIRVEGPA
jgi:Sulfatase